MQQRKPALTLRSEKAAVTRRRIAEAARRSFALRGYGATRLTEIAREAGVAVQTVYAIYRSKAGILRELRQGVLRDAEADEFYESAVSAQSLGKKLDLFAKAIRLRWENGHDVVVAHSDAARTDSSVRREVERVMYVRRDGIRRFAATMGQRVKSAEAVLDALTLPEIYTELVDIHHWSADEYETWLAKTLKRLLSNR